MKYLWAMLIFIGGEVVAFFIFFALKKFAGPPHDSPANKWSVFKGTLERLTLLTGLLSGFPHILIAFGALKIGTRLRDDQTQISGNYYLAGNLISILLAMVYAIVIKAVWF